MEVDGPDISKYGVVVPNGSDAGIAGLAEKPNVVEAPSNLASIGRYVPRRGNLERPQIDQAGKSNWQM